MMTDFPNLTPEEQKELKRLLDSTQQHNEAFKHRLVQLLEKNTPMNQLEEEQQMEEIENYPWSPFAQLVFDAGKDDPSFAAWVVQTLQAYFDEPQI
jgi:hypothetical protein